MVIVKSGKVDGTKRVQWCCSLELFFVVIIDLFTVIDRLQSGTVYNFGSV